MCFIVYDYGIKRVCWLDVNKACGDNIVSYFRQASVGPMQLGIRLGIIEGCFVHGIASQATAKWAEKTSDQCARLYDKGMCWPLAPIGHRISKADLLFCL